MLMLIRQQLTLINEDGGWGGGGGVGGGGVGGVGRLVAHTNIIASIYESTVVVYYLMFVFVFFQITRIENLGHLKELRVLNLAGNLIDYVDMLSGMDALTELNLRRNRIKTIVSI